MPLDHPQLDADLEACQRRDRQAFQALYLATSPHLFGLARRILKREDWAEEALQETFVKVWNKADYFDPSRGHAFTWISTILRNHCLDRLRKEGREPLGREELNEELVASGKDSPLEALSQSERGQALKDCLEVLEEHERQSLLLAYWRGMTHTELSLHLERPLGTVKTWVRRGMEKLKGCLGP